MHLSREVSILSRQNVTSRTDQSQLPLPSSFLPIGVRFDAGFSGLDEPGVPDGQRRECNER